MQYTNLYILKDRKYVFLKIIKIYENRNPVNYFEFLYDLRMVWPSEESKSETLASYNFKLECGIF